MSLAEYRRRIDGLKSSISIKDLVERDGHKLVRNGGLFKLCCPFHNERTPSCVLYHDHGHCFGCDAHFDIFQYVMLRDHCDFKSAVEKLDGGGLSVARGLIKKLLTPKPKEVFLTPESLNEKWRDWLSQTTIYHFEAISQNLGVSDDSLCNLSWVWSEGHSAWAIPMFDGLRTTVGIRFRNGEGKKWALKGSRQGLFIPASVPHHDLYVTEGPTDCAAMLSMGLFAIGKAAAMQGPEEIVKFITKNKIRRVIVIADNDTAGLNGAKKLIDACPVPCCELVLPAKDAREFYRNGGTKELIENLLKSCVWRHPNAKLGHK
jgi:hypothetical protein